MTQQTAQQALRARCDTVTSTPGARDGRLAVAELATHGLWVGLHAGVVPRDEDTVQAVLAHVLRLADLRTAPTPLAPAVTGATDPVVDLDRPILCASLELLEEPGATGISLEDVSRRAHVSHASLCSTFADVQQLLADQIAFVADDAAVDALPPDVPLAAARLADQVSAFHSEPRATATFRLLTLTGLTRETARAALDAGLHGMIDAAGSPAQVAPLRVAMLALDALELSGETSLAQDAHAAVVELVALSEMPETPGPRG
jgi:AcrR family transcriptional regulator